VASLLSQLLPTTPLARSLSVQSILSATGEGVFLTGNAVFFTQVVGLSAAQVGLGLTLAGVLTFFVAIPLGRLTDAVGSKRMWGFAALAQALLYLLWPLTSGFASFLAVTIALEVVVTAARTGRGAYTLSVFTGADRVRSLAFMRSARNIGYTLGALLGGLALAADSLTAIRAVPVVTAVILGINALLVGRLPTAEHEGEPASPTSLLTPGALRNRGFLAMTACDGVISTNQVLLNVVIPLWLVEQTDAPRVLLAWLFGTNTVLAVLLQVAASRGAETVHGALRASRISAAFFVLSCLIVLFTHDTVGWVTIALVWVGHVTVTGAELFQSAGHWGLVSELSDPARRGEYQGAAQLGGTMGMVWAPATYTFLAINGGTPGWLLIAAIVVLATIGLHPAARAAQRHLESYPRADSPSVSSTGSSRPSASSSSFTTR
jgi:MFS family permease